MESGEIANDRKVRRRAVVAATIGNALEFYDFMVFALFAIQIGEAFFPSGNAYLSLMASLATFGAGFITRPIGAWMIGSYADRAGRRPALMLSMILMGVGIIGLVLTPGYAAIGIAAPIIAVLARLIQSFALGGEVGPSTAYLLENAEQGRRGWVMSFQRASQLLANAAGALVGLMLSLILTKAQFDAYGWRIALSLGALIIPFALIIRRSLPETVHVKEPKPAPHLGKTNSVSRTMVLGFLMLSAGTISSYVTTYMTTFGQATLHLSSGTAMIGQLLANAFAIVSALYGGSISDRLGRRPVVVIAFIGSALTAGLIFPWMVATPGALSFIASGIIFAMISGAAVSPMMATIAESLPKEVRARNFALVYALPVSIMGGTTQLVVTWLIHVTGNPLAVAWYPIGALVIGIVAAILLHESAPARLRVPQRVPIAAP
jgi:MHS family citrate/tricarballylate:H+ symporter-like MFS transporter